MTKSDEIKKSGNGFRLSKNSQMHLTGVHPDLIKVVERALQETTIDFAIVQGFRSEKQQDDLYDQGRTKPGKIVTWTKDSRHEGGFAIDFAAYKDGKIDWDASMYPTIAAAFKKASKAFNIPIVWGGDWKNKDWGHIELDKNQYPAQS